MKIALIGYGNMGQEVEQAVNEAGKHEVVSISYRQQTNPLDITGLKKADVAIDFTSPDIVLTTIEQVAKLGVNMVVGTTGWYDHVPKVKRVVNPHKIGLIYGQNFSIGANVFFQIVANAASLVNKYSAPEGRDLASGGGGYDVFGLEVHHRGKKDSPSGTAKKIADIIMKNFPKKKRLQNSPVQRQIKPEELHFASIRGGKNPGFHEITFDSSADEIRLSHQAHGRRGFALGAIMAAEFIKGKRGLHSFDELFA